MRYLLPAEYESYGLAAGTADDLVAMASTLIEAHCRRPTLLAASYTERVRLTAGAQTARLSYGPLLAGALTSVQVRYGRARRGEDLYGELPFGLQVATAFGLPGTWTSVDVATVDLYDEGREIGFGWNALGLPYNEAEVTYTAGFVTVPDRVKVACAQVVKNALATPALNVSSSRIDTMQVAYFAATLIDEDVRALLKPYVAEKLG